MSSLVRSAAFVGQWLRRQREFFLAPIVMSCVVLLLYREVWWGVDGRLLWFGWDVPESYWPDLAYLSGALHHGELPLWNPYERGGYPFYGDTVYGLYYPVTWLLAAPGALAGSFPAWAGQLKQLIHWAMGATFLYAYLRTRKLSWAASGFGGVAWIVSLPMIVHKASALNWNLVWAPIVWIATDRLIDDAGRPGWWRRAALLAGSIGIAGAAGPPPAFFYLLIACGLYGVFRLATRLWDAHRAERAVVREVFVQSRGIALAALWSLALLLVIVLPGMAIAELSYTRGASRNLAYALNSALPVASTLRGLLAPTAGAYTAYLGLLPLLFALAALVLVARKDRGAPVFFVLLAAFMMVLAFGGGTPVLPWLVKHVPGFGLFREPNRYKCVAALAIAVAAAHGLGAIEVADNRRRTLVVIAAAAASLLALALILHFRSEVPAKHRPEAGIGTSVFVVLAGAVFAAGYPLRSRRAAPFIGVALCALAYLDVTSFGLQFIRVTEAPTDDREDLRYLSDLGNVSTEWRVFDEFVMEQRPGSRLRIRNFRGYPSMDPFADQRYAEVMRQLRVNPELLRAFNVKWVLHGAHHRNGKRSNFIKTPPSDINPSLFRKLDAKRYEVVDPAPLVQWYGRVVIEPDRKAALTALAAIESTDGSRDRAIVEHGDIPAAAEPSLVAFAATPAQARAGQLVSYGANEVVVSIDAPAPGLVVTNEKLFPGWTVTVDGAPAEPIRANYLLRGVVVSAGKHVIVWSYWPPRYGLLFGLWLAGGLAILAVFAVPFARRRLALARR